MAILSSTSISNVLDELANGNSKNINYQLAENVILSKRKTNNTLYSKKYKDILLGCHGSEVFCGAGVSYLSNECDPLIGRVRKNRFVFGDSCLPELY
jgi:hypothetical protein